MNLAFNRDHLDLLKVNISSILKAEDPTQLINKMNSIQGIRNLDRVFSKTPQGKKIFENLKRSKLEDVIGSKLVDSTTQQAKLGTFSKLLDKGKNRELIKEILSPDAFKRLEKLQKNAGRLANSVEKFYNASKSGAVAADAAVIATGMSDFASLLMGNPWPLLRLGSGVFATKKLSNLLSDPKFLKLTEEAILASEKSGEKEMINSFLLLKPYFLQSKQEFND